MLLGEQLLPCRLPPSPAVSAARGQLRRTEGRVSAVDRSTAKIKSLRGQKAEQAETPFSQMGKDAPTPPCQLPVPGGCTGGAPSLSTLESPASLIPQDSVCLQQTAVRALCDMAVSYFPACCASQTPRSPKQTQGAPVGAGFKASLRPGG